jgi:hypothetical protein
VEADNAAAKPEITRKRINGLAKQSAAGLATVRRDVVEALPCSWNAFAELENAHV